MRQWRRRACAVALATATPMLATGCGGVGSGSSGNELHVLVGALPQAPHAQKVWFKELRSKFKARTGGDLVFETYSDSSDEATKIQTSAVSGTGPDVYSLGTTFTPVADATGGFATLSARDWKEIGGRGRFIPKSLAMSGPNRAHQIGVPTAIRPYGMVYNKKMFASAGIHRPPATWDELVQDATRMTKPSKGVYGLALDYADGYDPWKYIWTLAEQSGSPFVSKDGKTAQLDSPQVVKATSDYFDLLTKDHVVDPASVGWDADKALAAFSTGKAAILPMVTSEVVPTLDSSPVKGDYAFAPLPQVPPGMNHRPPGGIAASSIVSGDDLSVASYSQNKDLALKFLNLVTSKRMQMEQARLFGYIPSNREAAHEFASGDPHVQAFLEAEDSSVPTAYTGAWSDVQNGLINVVTQTQPALAKGGYSPAKVRSLLGEADRTVQSAIRRSHR